jgi:EpsI family protein
MGKSILANSISKGLLAAVCLILILQAGVSHLLGIQERNLPIPGLHALPLQAGRWRAVDEQTLEPSVEEYLKPSEYILRDYLDPSSAASVNLFVAYFPSLQNTYGPHAPRICLPGSGWLESSSAILPIRVPGRAEAIPVNQDTYEKSGVRILVLYWYQNDRDAWAEEFHAKLRLLPDLIRYRRSDVSLVRLIAPLAGATTDPELANCREFARLIYPTLAARLGSTK